MSNESNRSTSIDATIANRRSWVRVLNTYGAGVFLFVFGPILVVSLLWLGKTDDALNVFNILLPVASAIVSFWFAGRERPQANEQK